MLEIIFLVFLCGYFFLSVFVIIGADKKFSTIDDKDLPNVSVIVAARNEEDKILRCMKSLDNLIYPEGKLEIILVDDNSTDNTGNIIDEFISDKNRFKKINSKKEIGKLKGKTNALSNAIEVAEGEVIFTTDADCEVKPKWVYSQAKYYKEDVAIVNGYTTQETYGGFSGMQALDFIYLQQIGAGTINLKIPISCIGNNMSYRKKAYEEVGGYDQIPFSVTEDFQLLNAIYKLKKYKLVYPLNPDALITSLPCKNFKELYRQKKRWSVGGIGIPFSGILLMAIGLFTNLFVVLTPFFYSPVWLYLVFLKIVLDFFVIYHPHNKLGIKNKLKYFLQFQIYYMAYVVVMFIVLFFNRKVIWKDREY